MWDIDSHDGMPELKLLEEVVMPQTIRKVAIEEKMQAAYLDYAMSVIVARALPDVRDGLKPVHRRILYAMYDMGLTPEKPYRKSARIVGEVLGKYHPHGDAAVYDAMARMAQDFSLRYPLVDGQGNFGSIDGDRPAAMRYTEARLSPIGMEMLQDIEKETVDFAPNFDGILQEPTVLPSPLPNLLVNGASGIAVGMASNIPPHNLREVVDALVYLIDKEDEVENVTVEDLMQFIQGPDFPTGGIVYRYDAEGNDMVANAYASGRGKFYMQGKVRMDPGTRGRTHIIITELPYQTDKTRLIERIAGMARDGKIQGIVDLRDESDRQGMRIVVVVGKNADAHEVLRSLFRLTPLQTTFGVGMLALVDGEPRTLSLKRMLLLYLEHRRQVITRRSKYDLAKAEARAHILEGLLRALDVLDEVIATIRRSRTTDTARKNLMKNFKFTELQAQAILDMPLKRLAALERKHLEDEYKEKKKTIRYLKRLLKSKRMMMEVIRQELLNLKERYGDPRRTQIVQRSRGVVMAHEAEEAEDVLAVVNTSEEIYRVRMADHRRGTVPHRDQDIPQAVGVANTHHILYVFTDRGRVAAISMHMVTEDPTPLKEFFVPEEGERVIAMLSLPRDEEPGPEKTLLIAMAYGRVKRVLLKDVLEYAHGVPTLTKLGPGDRVVGVVPVEDETEAMLFTAGGRSIRFPASDVRPMGFSAAGVRGIDLSSNDEVVSLSRVMPKGDKVACVTRKGYGKWSPLDEYPSQHRGGSGVITVRLSPGDQLASGIVLAGKEEVFVATNSGQTTYMPWSKTRGLPKSRRDGKGRKVVKPKREDRIERFLLVG